MVSPKTHHKGPSRHAHLHVCRPQTGQTGLPTLVVFQVAQLVLCPSPQPYRSYFAQQLLFSLAEQGLALNGCNGFWVQLPHGLASQSEHGKR